MGFLEVLTLIFVVMKLVGQIDWSWWLVLSPTLAAWVVYAPLIIYVLRKKRRMSRRVFR